MYSMDGFATALGEITLVLFTTLAPTGAIGFCLMALPLVFGGGLSRWKSPAMGKAATVPEDVLQATSAGCGDAAESSSACGADAYLRLEKYLCIPVLVAMVGLVASTTHLGSPDNALYVLTGVGRSPLSNEVASGVLFLGGAGIYWLTSFSETRSRRWLRRISLMVVLLLALLFVACVSLAYNAETIITWAMPLAPLSLWLNALFGGPLLALLGFRLARFSLNRKAAYALWGVAAGAFAFNIAVYLIWNSWLPSFENAMTTAAELSPIFGLLIGAFCCLGVVGLASCAVALRFWPFKAVMDPGRRTESGGFGRMAFASGIDRSEEPRAGGEVSRGLNTRFAGLILLLLGVVCVHAAIFAMRFAFYMTHMTVGLGV